MVVALVGDDFHPAFFKLAGEFERQAGDLRREELADDDGARTGEALE